MKISAIAVTRKDVFDQCHQLYKYRYHLKIPSPVEEPFYFVYGKIIHRIAEEFVKSKGETPIREVVKAVYDKKIPIDTDKEGVPLFCPEIPQEYKERMPGHLHSIQKLCDKIGVEGETEYKFNIDIDPPNNKFLAGVIDRFIVKDGKYYIIDYKTTKKGFFRKNSNTIQKDLQLRTYSRVIQKQYNVSADNIRAALYYLEGGDLISAKYSQASLESAEKELLNTYNLIESTPEDTVWGNVGPWCQRCSYSSICPFYKKK